MSAGYEPEYYKECNCEEAEEMGFYEKLQQLKEENMQRLERLKLEVDLAQEEEMSQITRASPQQQHDLQEASYSHLCYCPINHCHSQEAEYHDCDTVHRYDVQRYRASEEECPVSRRTNGHEVRDAEVPSFYKFDNVDTDSEDNEFEMRLHYLTSSHKKRRKKRARSASAAEKRSKTIVEPFQMTVRYCKDSCPIIPLLHLLTFESFLRREEARQRERDEMIHLLRREQERKDKVEEEMEGEDRIFRARPVPSHVHQPVFEDLVRKNPQRLAYKH